MWRGCYVSFSLIHLYNPFSEFPGKGPFRWEEADSGPLHGMTIIVNDLF